MNTETSKNPWQVETGDVILRHPDHPTTTGEWRVIGDPKMAHGLTTIPYEMPDRGEGVFVLHPDQMLSVRPATTYRVHALFTPGERETALQMLIADARDNDRPEKLIRFAALVNQGWAEIFDVAYMRVERHATHDASKETTA